MELIDFFICVVLSFFCYILSRMAHYSMQFGQLFDIVKLGLCKKLDADIYNAIMHDVNTISVGEEKTAILMDIMCAKYKIVGLLDCPYCLGFWISFLVSFIGFYFIGPEVLIIPFLTFFFNDKL